jgi:ribulose-phosphate 3-epimerase
MMHYTISASILSANFAELGKECEKVLSANADRIHFDVMDNHYVPNLTIGPMICKALSDHGIKAPIDVHLMTQPVDNLIVDFAKAGASIITFHPEATKHIDRSLQLILDHGCKAGLAFNPATPFNYLHYVMDKIDEILIMSVNPGFGGQQFIPTSLNKIKEAQQLTQHSPRKITLAVDGGIKLENIKQIATAGAQVFVIGSAIFTSKDYAKTIQQLRHKLAST